VWIMQVGGLSGRDRNAMSRLDAEQKKWIVDDTQPKSAHTSLSKDHDGNPIFVTDEPYTPYIYKDGNWTKMEGCMGRVAWGGDGSMYRRSCVASNYGYVEKYDS